MDWLALREKATDTLKRYRYVVLVLAVGMFLLLLPEQKNQEIPVTQQTSMEAAQPSDSLQNSLEEILSKIEGAGKVRVLLTEAAGERIIYQTDENLTTADTSSDIRRETVIVSDAGRTEKGLVQQVHPPVYLGAVIVCQGADKAAVRLSIVEAVANATGLSTDKISVLKMKG
jgi:stage III sporulation protein AG